MYVSYSITFLSSFLSANTCHMGPKPANLLSQPHLSWIICWLTPDTFMSLTRRLPTIALPNGLRPPILQVSVVVQLNSVQEQTLPNWPHMLSQSSDLPAGQFLWITTRTVQMHTSCVYMLHNQWHKDMFNKMQDKRCLVLWPKVRN